MNRILQAAFVTLAMSMTALAGISPKAVIELTRSSAAGLTLRATLPTIADIMSSPDLQGTSVVYKDDETGVPSITRWVIVPAGTRPVVSLKERTARRLSADGMPNGEVRPDELTGQKLWPSEPYSVGDVGVYRGMAIAAINFYPLQLKEDGSGVENSNLDVTIDFRPDPSAPEITPVRDRSGARALRMIDDLVINQPARDPEERQSEYTEHILMVRSTAMQNQDQAIMLGYVDSLATWKRQMGYKVSIAAFDLDVVGIGAIRDSIKANYYHDVDDPISHLIILGGDTDIPYFPSDLTKGDHFYSLMDGGNDEISDITVGRMFATSTTEFRGIVKRSILYERQPFVQAGTGWFKRALYTAENIAAPGGQFVPSMIQLGRWIWYRWNQMGYSPIDTLYAGGGADSARQVTLLVREILSRQGVSVAISRGWLDGCLEDDDITPINTGRKNPFVSAITCLSADVQKKFFHNSVNIQRPTGPIASLAIWNLTHSKTNNALMGGQMRAMYEFGMHQPGVIQNYSKLQVRADYAAAPQVTEEMNLLIWCYRLMGDPTVDVFTDVPDTIEAVHAQSLVTGTTAFNIEVSRGGEILPGAVVCVKQDDMSFVAVPGEDGVARFNFPSGLAAGNLKVTVTAHNSIPYFATIPVQVQNMDLVLIGYELDGPNQDYRAGDSVRVIAEIRNPGQNAANNVWLLCSSESPWVTFSPAQQNLGNIAGGSVREAEFTVIVNRSAPDGEIALIDLRMTSGERAWEESFELPISAANITATTINFGNGDRFDRGRTARVLPALRNTGRVASVAVDAELISRNPRHIVVTGAAAQYGAANPGANLAITGQFTVRLDSTAIPGNPAQFDLILRARGNDAFRDTLHLAIPIGHRRGTDPLGPDEYGYLCFDNFDSTWSKHPSFTWREINPTEEEAEFEGTQFDMEDLREDEDKTMVIDLPFPFKYYGEEFEQIAVCTNGWIAFGADKGIFVDFRNTTIPGVLGPDAQLAVMWDDLIVDVDGVGALPDRQGVYYHYVDNEGIFIIEWSKMQVFRDGTFTPQEVQIILRDPRFWPTRSGDGEILYQYKTFLSAEGNATDNQYCTIGIKNLDGTGGLQYTYADQWYDSLGVREITDGAALLFTTDLELLVGSVSGTATLFENENQPMQGVTVTIPGVATAVTGVNGQFSFPAVPTGNYTVIFSKQHYNQSRVDVTVRQQENSVANARMTHPTARIVNRTVDAQLDDGNERGSWNLNVANDGNGPLEFSLALRAADGRISQLPQRMAVDLTRFNVNDSYFNGVELVDSYVYVASQGDPNNREDNQILILDYQGREVARLNQPSTTGYGFKDLAFDGTYLWGGEDSMVVQFDRGGRVQRSIRIPNWSASENGFELNQPANLAWDPRDSTLLMSFRRSPVYKMNLNGEIVNEFRFTLPRHIPDISGFAWNSGDPDGMPLYGIVKNPPGGGSLLLIKTNFIESKVVKEISTFGGESGSGLAIGFDWQKYTTSAFVIMDAGLDIDTLRVFELGPDTRGVRYPLETLLALAGTTRSVPITFASVGLDTGVYRFSMVTFHNAAGDSIVTPVNFNVVLEGSGLPAEKPIPAEVTLEPAYPNPFNSMTKITFSVPSAGRVLLAIYDLEGREVVRLVDGEVGAGQYSAVWDAGQFSSGIYIARLEAGGKAMTIRTVLLK